MRQEQDSLGEIQLSENAYFGIATARLLAIVAAFGPEIPPKLAVNIIRVRQAQAMACERSGAWSESLALTLQAAAEKLIADEVLLAAQLQVCMLHGGGARSIVANVDEVLANVALELQQKPKGEYHLFAPLFRLDSGFAHQTAFLMALHITLVQQIELIDLRLDSVLRLLRKQAQVFASQRTIARISYQDVKISNAGVEFACCAESLERISRQLASYRSDLLRVWSDAPESIAYLQELVQIKIVSDGEKTEFPVSSDLYCGLGGLFKTTAMSLLQFCGGLRVLVGLTKELELPKRCASPVFNPAGREMVALDTVSQISFQLVGGDAAITAAVNNGAHGAVVYLPLISTHLINGAHLLCTALMVLEKACLPELSGNAEACCQKLDETPLQAEKLIPLLGYDRAVQVARIAALTEKPVRTVVVRMKLLNEAQADELFAPQDGVEESGQKSS